MNCDSCDIECTYELLLSVGSTEGYDRYTCSSCRVNDDLSGEF